VLWVCDCVDNIGCVVIRVEYSERIGRGDREGDVSIGTSMMLSVVSTGAPVWSRGDYNGRYSFFGCPKNVQFFAMCPF
jgi:hypothetical protein